MTASEINLTLNEVLSRVRPGLQKKILYSIDLIRKAGLSLVMRTGNANYLSK